MSYQQPDTQKHFDPYDNTFIAKTLIHTLDKLKDTYTQAQRDPTFITKFRHKLAHFIGHPNPIYHATRLSRKLGDAQIHLKRKNLNHTNTHKINNTIGQALLARQINKPRVITETNTGQHGVTTATICTRYGLEYMIYMGSKDMKRQSPNVYHMHLLSTTVIPINSNSHTLKNALNETLRDQITNIKNTFYIINTITGPHPYPTMVRDFQRVIDNEYLQQIPEIISRQPNTMITYIGSDSNTIKIFYPYIEHAGTRLIKIETTKQNLDSNKHAASLTADSPNMLHGNHTYLLQDTNKQITKTHSISADLDYPNVDPKHSYLKDIGRAEYIGITNDETLAAFHRLCHTKKIIPALKSSHAVAQAIKMAPTIHPDQHLLVNLSNRNNKNIDTVADLSDTEFFYQPSCQKQSIKGTNTIMKIVK